MTGPRGSRRRGSLLAEAGVALALLGILMGMTVQTLGWSGGERRLAEQRLRARQEAANLLDRVALRPAEALDAGRLDATGLGGRLAKSLPDGRAEWDVAADPDLPALRRVTLTIRWRGPRGNFAPPVRLTTWIVPEGQVPGEDAP